MIGFEVKAQGVTTMIQKRDKAPLLLTAIFVLLVLAVNFQLFTRPIVEAGDYAANSGC